MDRLKKKWEEREERKKATMHAKRKQAENGKKGRKGHVSHCLSTFFLSSFLPWSYLVGSRGGRESLYIYERSMGRKEERKKGILIDIYIYVLYINLPTLTRYFPAKSTREESGRKGRKV